MHLASTLALIRAGRSALKGWRELPADERERFAVEAQRVKSALGDVRHASGSKTGRWRRKRGDKKWQRSRVEALNPSPEFALAVQLVALLTSRGETDIAELAALLGAANEQDETLAKALKLADADGRMEREGDILRAVTEDVILRGNETLRRTGHIDDAAARIRECVFQHGLISLKDLAVEIERPRDDRSFRAALQRTLEDGTTMWLAPGTYGISVDELATFAPTEGGTESDAPSLASALAELARAASALREPVVRVAMEQKRQKALKAGRPGAVIDAPLSSAQQSKPDEAAPARGRQFPRFPDQPLISPQQSKPDEAAPAPARQFPRFPEQPPSG